MCFATEEKLTFCFLYFWVFPAVFFNIPHSASEANAWPAVSLRFITPILTDLSRAVQIGSTYADCQRLATGQAGSLSWKDINLLLLPLFELF